jgi:hypothetical protein
LLACAPLRAGRKQIFDLYLEKVAGGKEIDSVPLARGTPGCSGATISNIVNLAALSAATQKRDKVTMRDLESAKDRVFMGAERKSHVMTKDALKLTAYHEVPGPALHADVHPRLRCPVGRTRARGDVHTWGAPHPQGYHHSARQRAGHDVPSARGRPNRVRSAPLIRVVAYRPVHAERRGRS